MPSSLGYAILALLAAKPQSGYDISRQMKRPQGYVWQARHGQIYPELARLAKSGLVDCEPADKSSGPPSRVQSITAAGRAELARWVAQPPHVRPMNDELVVKAYAMRRVQPAAARSLLDEHVSSHERRLAALEQMVSALSSREGKAGDLDARRFGELAALRHAIGAERDYISWCRWLRDEMGLAERTLAGRRAGTSRAR